MSAPIVEAESEIRDALAASVLAEIPKLLTLLNRNPASPTYGCFDRSYWHYRIADFPCGMSQEFVWPLALVWSLELPNNPYRGQPALRDWIEAGIRFAARSSHRDGSCDDYYPFERAAGASAFSLLAMLEAANIIGLSQDEEIEQFFARRAGWLAGQRESGRLSNHEALIVASLVRLADKPRGERWHVPMRARLDRLLSWQSAEGWFDEYGGADPGYCSLTIGLLAEIDQRRPDLGLRQPVRRAVEFVADFVHPDGSVGGEYGSRGTLNYFPHGVEIVGSWMPEALAINDRALRHLADGRSPCYSDDRIIGHHLWSRLLAWKHFRRERPTKRSPPSARKYYAGARMLSDRRGPIALYAGLGKGAAFKVFDEDRLIVSDTGPTLRTKQGRLAVTHLDWDNDILIDDDRLVVTGRMLWAKEMRLTPARNIILRAFGLTLGASRQTSRAASCSACSLPDEGPRRSPSAASSCGTAEPGA